MNSTAPARILLVTDHAALSRDIADALADDRREINVSKPGADVLERLELENDDYSLFLVSVNQPERNGFATAERIRDMNRFENTPIIFLAESDSALLAAKASPLPFADCLSTPVDPLVLRTKVDMYVDLHRKALDMRQQVEHGVQLARAQSARDDAERAMRRSELLAEASRDLSRSLDFDDTLSALHRAIVPSLADACQVLLCDTRGELWFSTIDDSRGKSGDATGSHSRIERVPADLGALVNETLHTGHAKSLDGPLTLNAPNLRSPEPWDGAAVVPLIARGVPIGAVVCCRRHSGPFSAPDVVLFENLAGRAATAIDNAQLFQTIREGERRKDEFLAMLGHELRNPLAAITNAGELTRLLSPTDQSFPETLEIIRQQASLMKRLVDDLLDVSRITSGRIQLHKTCLSAGQVVARMAEANSAIFTSRNQVLHLSMPEDEIHFEADPYRIEQILSNLLVNASKYTDQGGEVWFGVSRDDDQVVFRVKDTGVGIGPDLLPHVFDLFSQANRSLHRSEGGLGIGLTIVKGLTDLHDGRVWAFSDGIGRGSQFAVWLPAHPVGHDKQPAHHEPDRRKILPAQRRRVLVVEDQPALLRVTVALLKRLGHEVYSASDGPEAILTVREYRPEVVFLDIGLPEMNGYDVARSIRHEYGDQAPLLVAMTGYGQHEVERHSARAKFDCHLVKPVDVNAMQKLFQQMNAGAESRSS